ncbi:MAG: hypothetical protein OXC15_10945 [Rhodospirillaceae bacterium]|nr:hypothetical protein [Rhodospirillaceae bacterium]
MTIRKFRRDSGYRSGARYGLAVLAAFVGALLLTTGSARADVLSEMNRFWQGAAVNTTGRTFGSNILT